MPQDARNKLRQMGGITAAFPEMVQAQQEMPMAPVYGPAPATGSMGRALARDPIRELIESRGMGGGALQENPPAGVARRDMRERTDFSTLREILAVPEEERAPNPRMDSRKAEAQRALEEARKQKLAEMYGPGSEGGPTRPRRLDDPEEAQRMADEAIRLLNIPTGDGDGEGEGDGDTPAAPTLRDTYNEELSLVMEVLGEDDKDAARDKALTLAMVGLAALTGPRGQFLQNLAEGALIGLSATGKRREKRRERERELKTFALQSAIDKQTARAQADARAAEQQFSRDTQLAVARTNALGRGGGGIDFEATKTIAEVARDLPGEVAQDFSEGLLTYPSGMDDPQEQQQYRNLQVRERALNYARDLLSQASPGQAEQLMRGAQEYLYRGENNLPIVRGPRDLTFILPGQEYLKVDPVTGKYTKEKKGE